MNIGPPACDIHQTFGNAVVMLEQFIYLYHLRERRRNAETKVGTIAHIVFYMYFLFFCYQLLNHDNTSYAPVRYCTVPITL